MLQVGHLPRISDFIGNHLFLNMFRASLRPSSGGQTAFSLPMVFCPVVTVVMLESHNRADNHRQCNAVWPPDDGCEDARNM